MKKQDEDKIPDVEKDGWKAEKLAEEASNKEDDEIVRQMQIDDESDSDLERIEVAPVADSTAIENDEDQDDEK